MRTTTCLAVLLMVSVLSSEITQTAANGCSACGACKSCANCANCGKCGSCHSCYSEPAKSDPKCHPCAPCQPCAKCEACHKCGACHKCPGYSSASVDNDEHNTNDMAAMAAMAVYGLGPDDVEAASYIEASQPIASASTGSANGSGLRALSYPVLFVGLLLWCAVLVAVKLNWERLSVRKTPELEPILGSTA